MSQADLRQSFVYGEVVNDKVLSGLGSISGRLLDVGSGAGAWAGRLRGAGAHQLVALDPSPQAITLAATRYDAAIEGTIEGTELDQLGGEPFDVIILADVLEHLVDPWRALRKLRSWARPQALFAVSVPNMRYYKLVGNLALRGDFEYESWGVRDWTHLRWFTRRSLARMLSSSGWTPDRWIFAMTYRGRLASALSRGLAEDLLCPQLTVIAVASAPDGVG